MRRLGVVVIVLAGLMLIGSAFGIIATSSVSLAGIQDSGTDAWTIVVPFLLGITAVVGFGVWLG